MSAWVNREIALADRRSKAILPILLRGRPFFSLFDRQYLDSSDGSMPGPWFIGRLRQLLLEPTDEPNPDAATSTTVKDPGPTKVFINYRREDSQFAAHWPCATLTGDEVHKPLSRDSLFIDLGVLVGGDDFHAVVSDAIKQCRIMLVLIGANWLTAMDNDGVQRLHLPTDMLREEIEIALEHGLKVIPVLLGQARVPQAKHLPAKITPLQQRHAVRLEPNAR